jgi:hypothetical protein
LSILRRVKTIMYCEISYPALAFHASVPVVTGKRKQDSC